MVQETYHDRFNEIMEQARFWKDEEEATEGVQVLEEFPGNLVVTGIAMLAGVATRKTLMKTWSKTTGRKPPINPNAAGVDWKDALLWAAVAGATVGTVRVLARKGTAELAERYGRSNGSV